MGLGRAVRSLGELGRERTAVCKNSHCCKSVAEQEPKVDKAVVGDSSSWRLAPQRREYTMGLLVGCSSGKDCRPKMGRIVT